MLAEASEPLDTPGRYRLFDMLMRRLDALQPYKEALGIILQDQLRDPLGACCGLGRGAGLGVRWRECRDEYECSQQHTGHETTGAGICASHKRQIGRAHV